MRKTTWSLSPSWPRSRSTIPQSKKIRVESGSGRTSQTGPPFTWSISQRGGFDSGRQRGAVQAMVTERLRRSAARGPAFHAEHRDASAVELAPDRVAQRSHRGVILQHEDAAERGDRLAEPAGVDAVQPWHVHDLEACPS